MLRLTSLCQNLPLALETEIIWLVVLSINTAEFSDSPAVSKSMWGWVYQGRSFKGM
jgi:hypothetical protein